MKLINEYWIGVDGTDSPFGGCTTWTMSNIIDRLIQNSNELKFLSYPKLVRLNPNIPNKTRGNGALSLHIETELELREIANLVTDQIKIDQQKYELNPDKLPGLVISKSKPPAKVYYKALQELLDLDYVLSIHEPDFIWPKYNQSHIGAIAGIACTLDFDFTFELLSYRKLENCGKPRILSSELVKKIAKKYSSTFSSYDYSQDRELIMPAGPDPVFCGIRGDDPEQLVSFFEELSFQEKLQSFTIFQTNQGTNAHTITPATNIGQYNVFSFQVQLIDTPTEIRGGHVFCKAISKDMVLELAWFEPTKTLRDIARLLISGDKIHLTGSVHFVDQHDLPVIHVEEMLLIDVPIQIITKSPICECGQRMTSAGSFAGYKCRNCSTTSLYPETTKKERSVYNGQRVYASKSAQRHLTRPIDRRHIRNRKNCKPQNFRVNLSINMDN